MKLGVMLAFAGRDCGGPEVYERELVRALDVVAPQHEYHLYCLAQRAPEVIGVERSNIFYHRLRPSVRALAMFASLPAAMRRTQPKVFPRR